MPAVSAHFVYQGGNRIHRSAGLDAVTEIENMSGLRAEGLRTPQDVAVIGVDDIPAARLAAPALTTIWQAIDAQARYLADAVLAALDDTAEAPAQPDDVFHVIARDST